MSFDALLIHTVTVTTPNDTVVGTDLYGNPQYGETVAVERVRVEPGAGAGRGVSEELQVDRDTRLTRFKVFAQPGTSINGRSSINWGGRTLRVDGEPLPFYARHSLHHYELDAEEILAG